MNTREGHWLIQCFADSKHLQQAQGPWELTLDWHTGQKPPNRKAVFGLSSSRWQSDPVTCAAACTSSAWLAVVPLLSVLRHSSKRLFSSSPKSLKGTQRGIILTHYYWKSQTYKAHHWTVEVWAVRLGCLILGVKMTKERLVTVTYLYCLPVIISVYRGTAHISHWVTGVGEGLLHF